MVAITEGGVLAAANRVPKVTADFWLVKLLAVTMGETAADYLAVNLGFGLSTTSWIMSIVLAITLILQFRQGRYVPWSYWAAVVMISVVGTLITDNLVDNLGIALESTTAFFSVALAMAFAFWYLWEEALSIHSVITTRREIFYWLAILFTFSLGTAAGDLVAEKFALGYFSTGMLFLAIVDIFWLAYLLGVNSIFCFWLAYIFTRPLGASFGNLLSQPMENGGLGFGTTFTSLIFLAGIVITVIYMTVSHDGEELSLETN